MSGATDSGMVKTMGVVMACLGVLAVVCVLAARMLGLGSEDYADPLKRNALIQRIQPMAAVRTSAEGLEGAEQVAAADAPAKTGEELVNGACAACHVAGVAGAPKLDDEAAWAERREAGLDALVSSVINGKGSMPARGGSTYSDDEIKLAVQHIALFETDESSAEAPAEAESDTALAATESDPAAETASAESTETATTEVTESTAESTETATTESTESATTESTEESATAEAPAEAAQTDTASEDAAPAGEGGEAMAALVVGEVPDGLTDNIKATVDGVCAGCHMAGVANAPKNGDRVAWQERADKGLDALTSSVINGLNVMPARGGSALTDEEIPIAIQYLMSK